MQSGVPSQTHWTESLALQVVPTGLQVETSLSFSGGTQHCCFTAQWMSLPPSTALKGQ
jgi:hypothetical protein